ncbi:transposase [Pseudomonas sp. LP_7_YM]|uniref:transposase n=1 Tax=Pseudomonas sp. LP_7_YM TaxID=2485137 RepID=UPI00106137D3
MQPTRRSYSKSFKAQVIQECAQPGASIASIALNHSLNVTVRMRPAKSSTQPRKAKTWCALKFKWAPALAF